MRDTPVMKVAVVGGTGYFGSRTAQAIRAAGFAVETGGRAFVDATHAVDARRWDAVVNCSDSYAAPPDAAAQSVLSSGGVWIETTAEPETIRRLLALRGRCGAKGVVVVGMGLFPGMSNLLAASALRASGATSVRVGLRLSPFAGAGRGMCSLMAHLFASTVERGAALEFLVTGAAETLTVPMPEIEMLRASTGLEEVSTNLATRPWWLRQVFRAMASAMPRRGQAAVLWLLERGFALERAVLLRRLPARTELLAIAGEVGRGLLLEDGVRAGGEAVAAAIADLATRPGGLPAVAPGVYTPDELFTAEALCARLGWRLLTNVASA